MISDFRSTWTKFCKFIVTCFEPVEPAVLPKSSWKVAYCFPYNNKPARVVVVQASSYAEAIDESAKIPMSEWTLDPTVSWTQDWAGMTAWEMHKSN